MSITAPYHFVPLAEQVYFPEWSALISQDVPFSDGIDGEIVVNIEALSPIFVRNGHTREDHRQKTDTYRSFSHVEGRYFLPATSWKGAVRAALETLSFGKMLHINDHRYSFRDIKHKPYTNQFTAESVHAGLMQLKDGGLQIKDLGLPRRISLEDIDEHLHTNFCDFVTNGANFKKEENRVAAKKYELVKGKELHHHFTELPTNSKNPADKRIKVKFATAEEGQAGLIVFTGQPGKRNEPQKGKKASGKFYEFVFYTENVEQTFPLEPYEEGGLYEDFCFIYKDSLDWKYWRKRLEKGEEVPIFLRVEKGKLLHFGLSYLYKLPMRRIHEALPEAHRKQQSRDLAECIFGYTNPKESLKGRVHFSHAFYDESKGSAQELNEQEVYMGSPRPTYYPNYIRQEGSGGKVFTKREGQKEKPIYKTLLDGDARLRGWKRYPVRKDWDEEFECPKGQEENLNPFTALSEGSHFTAKVRFHNLRPVELGALLFALQLPAKHSCHMLGFAKPYGYGRSRITVKELALRHQDTPNTGEELVQHYIDCYTQHMDELVVKWQLAKSYLKTAQVQRFKEMSEPQEYYVADPLVYQKMDKDGTNDFTQAKQNGEYLPEYNEWIKKEVKMRAVDKTSTETATVVCLIPCQTQLGSVKYPLEGASKRDKLKIGSKVEVECQHKDGKIKELRFKRKLS